MLCKQVCQVSFRLATSRPLEKPKGASFLGREVAERATKSREVDLSRLKDFHLRFAPKIKLQVIFKNEHTVSDVQ